MSTSLDIAATITRGSLSLSTLTIHDRSAGYVLLRDQIGPGAISWRRNTTTSPFVHGRYVVTAVKDVSVMPIAIRVYGATHDEMDIRLAALIAAFEQFSYTLTIEIDSVVHSWFCECADWSIGNGGSFTALELYSHTQEIVFSVPRYPIPVSGRF